MNANIILAIQYGRTNNKNREAGVKFPLRSCVENAMKIKTVESTSCAIVVETLFLNHRSLEGFFSFIL